MSSTSIEPKTDAIVCIFSPALLIHGQIASPPLSKAIYPTESMVWNIGTVKLLFMFIHHTFRGGWGWWLQNTDVLKCGPDSQNGYSIYTGSMGVLYSFVWDGAVIPFPAVSMIWEHFNVQVSYNMKTTNTSMHLLWHQPFFGRTKMKTWRKEHHTHSHPHTQSI